MNALLSSSCHHQSIHHSFIHASIIIYTHTHTGGCYLARMGPDRHPASSRPHTQCLATKRDGETTAGTAAKSTGRGGGNQDLTSDRTDLGFRQIAGAAASVRSLAALGRANRERHCVRRSVHWWPTHVSTYPPGDRVPDVRGRNVNPFGGRSAPAGSLVESTPF